MYCWDFVKAFFVSVYRIDTQSSMKPEPLCEEVIKYIKTAMTTEGNLLYSADWAQVASKA